MVYQEVGDEIFSIPKIMLAGKILDSKNQVGFYEISKGIWILNQPIEGVCVG